MASTTSIDKIRDKITAVFLDVLSEHAEDENLDQPALESDTVLLETSLDSLGFAILVSQLEDELGFDPFTQADEAYYPRTFGEFVAFYHSGQSG